MDAGWHECAQGSTEQSVASSVGPLLFVPVHPPSVLYTTERVFCGWERLSRCVQASGAQTPLARVALTNDRSWAAARSVSGAASQQQFERAGIHEGLPQPKEHLDSAPTTNTATATQPTILRNTFRHFHATQLSRSDTRRGQ